MFTRSFQTPIGMNAVTSSPRDFIMEDTGGGGSDSDTNSDELPEYYQPISAEAEDEELELSDQQNSNSDSDETDHRLPNGYAHCMENGVSSLDLSYDDGGGGGDSEEKEEEDEEELRMREESDVAIQRAFREDESRRNAPLTPENAVRVMEAMRGVSFGGFAPDWAGRIPDDQWIDQLRRIRRPPPPS